MDELIGDGAEAQVAKYYRTWRWLGQLTPSHLTASIISGLAPLPGFQMSSEPWKKLGEDNTASGEIFPQMLIWLQ